MEAGCSLQLSNKEGETALHVAAVRGYYTIVRFLCGKGANMDAQDKVRERGGSLVPRPFEEEEKGPGYAWVRG